MSSYNAPVEKKPKFSVAISTPTYQNLIRNTLAVPERAKRFIASITSAVAVNPQLQECETSTIVAGALLGESLNLSPSPQLGQFYLVPFKQKAKYDRNRNLISPECVNAQFVLGYKGYIQLAVRSGMYRKIIVQEIKDGELIGWNPLPKSLMRLSLITRKSVIRRKLSDITQCLSILTASKRQCIGARIKCLCMQTSTALHLVKMRMQS